MQYFCFFFFKQKTAYEMRISDWSSDVCSSDLREEFEMRQPQIEPAHDVAGIGDAGQEGDAGLAHGLAEPIGESGRDDEIDPGIGDLPELIGIDHRASADDRAADLLHLGYPPERGRGPHRTFETIGRERGWGGGG